ncbi:MAG: hypothetical protein ACJAQ6_002203 [Arenicella sp.]|jgi:hypothetical protein
MVGKDAQDDGQRESGRIRKGTQNGSNEPVILSEAKDLAVKSSRPQKPKISY